MGEKEVEVKAGNEVPDAPTGAILDSDPGDENDNTVAGPADAVPVTEDELEDVDDHGDDPDGEDNGDSGTT